MHHLSEHPNVVRIKGTYEDNVFVHLVMELCAGGELFDRIVQKGHYSEREAAKLIKTIVGVVEACHSLGVMHRDLKPENFLFDSPGDDAKMKATDFGLSVFYKPGWSFSFLLFCLQIFTFLFLLSNVCLDLMRSGCGYSISACFVFCFGLFRIWECVNIGLCFNFFFFFLFV